VGPVLFLIYINDIAYNSLGLYRLLVDDTSMVNDVTNINTLHRIILKNDKTIVAYFVEYTVEKFEKFLII
jgi:hypothetical protein